jgi:uncharacterized protein YndB with AHSA1/START domain
MTSDSNVADAIERDIFIAAPIEKVWELVSVPGWWINDGTIDLDSVKRLDDGRAVVHMPGGGESLIEFPVERLQAEAPRTVTFRWQVSGAEVQRDEAPDDQLLHTSVTFTLTPEPGGTRVAVTESGFATATMDEKARRRAYTDNSEGWETELAAARAYCEARPAATA